MRKIDKIENEKLYTEIIKEWLLNRGYYYHSIDKMFLYWFMYDTYHLSWHKTQKIIFKNIPKKILDELSY